LKYLRLATFGLALTAVAFASLLRPTVVKGTESAQAQQPVYGTDGSLTLPANYREWIFLSSGIDMVYGPKAAMSQGHSMFDNVFVNPEAYRSFLAKGTWPDKTVFILEVRGADTNPSINHGGHSQGEVMGIEAHVKDTSRFPGGWAFFDINGQKGTLIPQTAACYSCHRDHGAVDTTFVQFYPTLLPVAKSKGTLSAAFLKEFGSTAPAK
jgi:hypothetical protein